MVENLTLHAFLTGHVSLGSVLTLQLTRALTRVSDLVRLERALIKWFVLVNVGRVAVNWWNGL